MKANQPCVSQAMMSAMAIPVTLVISKSTHDHVRQGRNLIVEGNGCLLPGHPSGCTVIIEGCPACDMLMCHATSLCTKRCLCKRLVESMFAFQALPCAVTD